MGDSLIEAGAVIWDSGVLEGKSGKQIAFPWIISDTYRVLIS